MVSRRYFPYVFITPFFLLFAFFFVFPVVYAMISSLYVNHFGVTTFSGLKNYILVFHDGAFWKSIMRVVYYGIIEVTIMLVLALILALILDSPLIKWKTLFRLIYFLPYAVPAVIAAIMWGFLYAPNLDSALNILSIFGGPLIRPLNLSEVLYAIVNISVWEWTGYNMTIYLASLTSIPQELYDAAMLDGCNQVQVARYIKLPLLRPTIILTIVLSIIGALQLFNKPYILSSLTAISSTYSPNLSIYTTAFSYLNINLAAAMSVITTIITMGASIIFLRLTRKAS